ncbi:MAG: DUF2237 family protein [Luteibaculaceae bacterium]
MARNVLGGNLILCSTNPLTGYFRDGCCKTDSSDFGTHTVCAQVTEEFLEFSISVGNNLSTPVPIYNFPGLKPGDFWCLCAARWVEAYKAGCAPKLKLEATHEKTLQYVSLDVLIEYQL